MRPSTVNKILVGFLSVCSVISILLCIAMVVYSVIMIVEAF